MKNPKARAFSIITSAISGPSSRTSPERTLRGMVTYSLQPPAGGKAGLLALGVGTFFATAAFVSNTWKLFQLHRSNAAQRRIGPLGMKQRTPSRKLVRLAYPLMSSAIAEGSDENAWSC